ncbi:MAG: glycosyltransferase [Candidatus Nanoarchaeia archaeon]
MVTIISLYNNKQALDTLLKPSLKDIKIEKTIFLNNTKNKFKSYNSSIQSAITKVKEDDVLIIVHQDVIFMDKNINKKISSFTKNKKYYFAGVVGVKKFKRKISAGGINNILNAGKEIGFKKISKPEKVEAIDGCVMITNKRTIVKYGLFADPNLKWHFYDVDSSLSLKKNKIDTYCLPIMINHACNPGGYKPEYFELVPYILKKHKIKKFYTTCGAWNKQLYLYESLKQKIKSKFN